MSISLEVVPHTISHKSSTKERIKVKSKQPEAIIRCVGDRKEPSREAVDRFISIYLDLVRRTKAN